MSPRLRWRKVVSGFMLAMTGVCALVAVSVLFFILGYLVYHGGTSISWNFFTKLPVPVGQLGKEVPTDGSSAVVDEVTKNEEEHGNSDEGADTGHGQHEAAYKFAPAETRAHALPIPLPRWEVATISKRAKPLRMKVRMKSTRPSSISDCVWSSPVASVNSLAITAAME